jgi:hypothetical protein
MDSHDVILRIDECLRTCRDERRRRSDLLEICRQNLHLSGNELFNAFRGHLDMVRLRSLATTWDTWRAVLPTTRTTTARPRRHGSAATA